MSFRARLLHLIPTAAVLTVLVACDGGATLSPDDGPLQNRSRAMPHSSAEQLLQNVKQATARFNSTTQAVAAGYVEDHFCVAAPGLGGMGHHWLKEGLVDPVFDPREPEVLLYAPGPNGKPQLVAVEYIVIDVGQDRPHFAGQPFDIGGTPVPVGHWSLHVWLYEGNPSGTFAPFNPNVECH